MLFCGTAYAADPAVSSDHDWSGFYIGANVGWGGADYSGCIECDADSRAEAEELNVDGLVGGLHAGYNWQTDNIVLGVEIDGSLANWSDYAATASDDESQQASVNFLGSARVRAGLTSGNGLVYATGGLAISDAVWESKRDDDSWETVDFNNVGGVIGAGVEYAVSEHMSIRAEGLYYIFNDEQSVADLNSGSAGESVTLDSMAELRVGASFGF